MTAIGDYFRTALLIDDSAVDTTEDLEPLGPIPADSEPTRLVETPSEGTPLNWNNIVNAFLEEEVVCSVLKPDREDDIQVIAIRGSKIADLLILDWDLFGDDGEDTKRAILRIVETAPRRLRVIVIYTEKSFTSVIDALIKECELTKESDFVFSKEATIVLVFGKLSIKPMEGEEESSRIASYSDLPKKIRKDLEDYFGGLVPELAFSGINIIRESAPRALATFDSSLDAPLLTHRALLPEVSDVGPQFIRLLTSEFEAALMESSLTDLLDEDSISERLEQSDIVKVPQILSERLEDKCAEEALASGFTKLGLNDNRLNRLLTPLVEAFGVGREPHESLAVLMSSTPFEDIAPRLEAGVILGNEGKYWLCVQPLCDSVRLTGPRKFPLLPLVVNIDETGSPKRDSEAMIRATDDTALPVSFSKKHYELLMAEFEPSENELSVLAQLEGDAWYFEDTNQTRYRAICRLRSEFTRQAVQKLTSGVARTGVDPSEWLRRSGRG